MTQNNERKYPLEHFVISHSWVHLGRGGQLHGKPYKFTLTFQYSDELSVGGDGDVQGVFLERSSYGVLILQEGVSCQTLPPDDRGRFGDALGQ